MIEVGATPCPTVYRRTRRLPSRRVEFIGGAELAAMKSAHTTLGVASPVRGEIPKCKPVDDSRSLGAHRQWVAEPARTAGEAWTTRAEE